MSLKTTPLYVVCAPHRSGGKTLISRLLTEYYVLDGRPVAAFDLADEGPQLTDYLPQYTTLADLDDIFSQMAFFERLIAENAGAKIIDVSGRRTFKSFFSIAQEIGLFAEARRHHVEPLILFIVDPDPKSPEVYADLRHRFSEASLLPVRNMTETSPRLACDMPANSREAPSSVEIPRFSFVLRALIDRQSFSFSEFWRSPQATIPKGLQDELQEWLECVFSQFRELELCLGCESTSEWIAARASKRDAPVVGDELVQGTELAPRGPTDGPEEVLTAPASKRDAPVVPNELLLRTESGTELATSGKSDVPEEVLKYAPASKREAQVRGDELLPSTELATRGPTDVLEEVLKYAPASKRDAQVRGNKLLPSTELATRGKSDLPEEVLKYPPASKRDAKVRRDELLPKTELATSGPTDVPEEVLKYAPASKRHAQVRGDELLPRKELAKPGQTDVPAEVLKYAPKKKRS